jgi:hypothetical protein
MSAVDDKKTIGVADNRAPTLDRMVASGRFEDAIQAATFAMAIAIDAGGEVGTVIPAVEGSSTKWNVGSFDNDRMIETLLRSLFPDVSVPYRLLEYLIDEGLRIVGEYIQRSQDFDPLMFLPADIEG